jgi:hypothetical protein
MNEMNQDRPKHLLPLSERNAETAAIAIREIERKLHEGLEVIVRQQATLSMLVQKVGLLEQLLNVQKMQMTGLGPSVKPYGNNN